LKKNRFQRKSYLVDDSNYFNLFMYPQLKYFFGYFFRLIPRNNQDHIDH